MEKQYLEKAYQQALKAYKKNEVPIGAVIVKNGVIIGKGYNLKEKKQNVTKHAEIIAISNANKKIKNWRLDDCDLYVTLEPCMMCLGAILQARIKNVYYVIPAENSFLNHITNKKTNFVQIDFDNKCLELIQKFFNNKRN